MLFYVFLRQRNVFEGETREGKSKIVGSRIYEMVEKTSFLDCELLDEEFHWRKLIWCKQVKREELGPGRQKFWPLFQV